jgi:KDO2-lipid IV(A) lauroyltransferase
VVYLNTKRVKRGYYEVTIEILAKNPLELEEGALTKLYMKKLEQILHKQPENWLWSHKRWKKKRSDIPKD